MSKAPPVPPAGRTTKGPGGSSSEGASQADLNAGSGPESRNVDKQGRQGNSKVNTTHQGYQQDR
jgi:hypothetical protein